MRFLFVLASMLGSVAIAGPTDAEAEAAARRVFDGSDYQLELPTDEPTPEPTTAPRRSDGPTWDTESSGSGTPDVSSRSLARFLWYLLLGVVLVGLLLWAGRELLEAKQRNVRAPAAVAAPTPAAPAAPGVSDHVKLAAAGRHAEAIHALLLATLREVHRRAGSLAPAWTSREILYKVVLSSDARGALEDVVRAVEVSRFGGIAAGAAEYAACVRQAEACRAGLPEKAA